MNVSHKQANTFIRKYNKIMSMKNYSKLNIVEKNKFIEKRLKEIKHEDLNKMKAEWEGLKGKTTPVPASKPPKKEKPKKEKPKKVEFVKLEEAKPTQKAVAKKITIKKPEPKPVAKPVAKGETTIINTHLFGTEETDKLTAQEAKTNKGEVWVFESESREFIKMSVSFLETLIKKQGGILQPHQIKWIKEVADLPDLIYLIFYGQIQGLKGMTLATRGFRQFSSPRSQQFKEAHKGKGWIMIKVDPSKRKVFDKPEPVVKPVAKPKGKPRPKKPVDKPKPVVKPVDKQGDIIKFRYFVGPQYRKDGKDPLFTMTEGQFKSLIKQTFIDDKERARKRIKERVLKGYKVMDGDPTPRYQKGNKTIFMKPSVSTETMKKVKVMIDRSPIKTIELSTSREDLGLTTGELYMYPLNENNEVNKEDIKRFKSIPHRLEAELVIPFIK